MMTTKDELLIQLKEALQKGIVRQSDIEELLPSSGPINQANQTSQSNQPKPSSPSKPSFFSAQNILYLIGTVILLSGVSLYIGQLWPNLERIQRVILTLGLGTTFYVSGLFQNANSPTPRRATIASILFLIAYFLIPIGLGSFMNGIGIDGWSKEGLMIISSLVSLSALFSFLQLRKEVFLYILALAGSVMLSSTALTLIEILEGNIAMSSETEMLASLAVGGILPGYILARCHDLARKHGHTTLSIALHIVGSAVILISGFAATFAYTWVLALYGGLLAIMYWLSMQRHSRTILIATTLATFVYIGTVNDKLFRDSLGLPVSLMITGICIVAVGYWSVQLGDKLRRTVSRS